MKKLIGYTVPSDLREFEYDGFIRVKKEAWEVFTEKVSFTELDVEVSSLTTLSEELENFHEFDLTIMVTNFTKEDK